MVTVHPFLLDIPNSDVAYGWAIAALIPAVVVAFSGMRRVTGSTAEPAPLAFGYSFAALAALLISASFALAEWMRSYLDSHILSWTGTQARLIFWTFASHLALALIVVSVVNLCVWVAGKTAHPRQVMRWLMGVLTIAMLWTGLRSFLQNGMSFDGWRAWLYAGLFAFTVTVLGLSLIFSLVVPFMIRCRLPTGLPQSAERSTRGRRTLAGASLLGTVRADVRVTIADWWRGTGTEWCKLRGRWFSGLESR